jgi:hypothetical protein
MIVRHPGFDGDRLFQTFHSRRTVLIERAGFDMLNGVPFSQDAQALDHRSGFGHIAQFVLAALRCRIESLIRRPDIGSTRDDDGFYRIRSVDVCAAAPVAVVTSDLVDVILGQLGGYLFHG